MKATLFTVILGGYDKLRPTKWAGSVCFTDEHTEEAEGWVLHRSWARSGCEGKVASRRPKILAHQYLPGAEYTIYVDGNVFLITEPTKLIRKWLKEHDIAVFRHPQRSCTYDEAEACIKYGKGDPDTIRAQMEHYRSEGFPLKFGLSACFVLIRKNTPAVAELNRVWWEEFHRYQQRDQLCFDYARWKTGIGCDYISGNLLKNKCADFRRGRHR